ncbi:uncharacterized protein LOC119744509 [Patiria miniata]|uniref:Uncharacterized protein n=1 Tax=Patiria miniata TaxID=46514 RepID=A0A914BJV5_PATMI|nr:uncharacterized protein LOC119744509 [Patiria miniata]
MPVISPPSSAPTCRRYPLLIITCLLVNTPPAPGRATSYRAPYPDNPVHQPSLPQYYYPSPGAVWGEAVESPVGKPDSGRQKREWMYNGRPQPHQESDRSSFNPQNAAGETSNSSPFMFGKWTSRNSVSKIKAQAYLASPYDYDAGLQNTIRQYQDGGRGFRAMPPFQPPPSSSHLPDLSHPHFFNYSSPFGSIGQRPSRASATGAEGTNKKMKRDSDSADTSLGGYDREGGKAGRNSVSRTGDQAYAASAYGAAKQNHVKRVAETADLSLGGYNRGRQRGGRGKRYHSQGQVFNAMPPFQPPPSSSLLPDLFTPQVFNDSFSIIGQRPTRPSATRPRLPGDRGLHSDNRGPQGPGREGQQEPHRDSQGPFGQDPYGQQTGQTSDTPRDLPTQGSEDPNAQQEQIHPRDVVVKIDTPRLQLTYRAIAPPYFTFEGLLSQMATYLTPGFCVDLAVTQRDEHCDIISHMAALQTDRQQTWLIEIVDTGGKIIWMNQCMPDARLFIVPGLRIYFKFGTHSLFPGSAFAVSTPGATPVGTQESVQTGLPASDSGWVPHGSPLAPQRRTSENS